MDERQFFEIINGNFSNIPKDKSKLVRIFLSSTFSDTHTERDYLIANIYPKLKAYCKSEYNLDFQILDMRWGISHELTNAHMATTICLDEIKKSQKYSIGPNFIALLSHRYGKVYLPTRIIATEYVIIKTEIDKSDEFNLSFTYEHENKTHTIENILDYCYTLDENETPARYRLRNLNTTFENINHKEEKFDELWTKLENQLGDVLRRGAQICYDKKLISKTEYERYFVSVTEKEIFNGIQRGKNLANNVLFFERVIEDIEEHVKKNPNLAAKFIDLDENNNIDEESKRLLNDLKYKKIPSKLPSSNIFRLKTKWSENGISLKTHLEYVKSFGDLFYEQVKKLIDKNYFQSNDDFSKLHESDQDLLQEVLYHAHFCNETVEKFHGREDILNNIKDYVLSDNRMPFVLFGESGCGKTAILAKATSQILSYVPDPYNYTIILRFLGTTPTTSNIYHTYCSLIHQISRLYNMKIQILLKEANNHSLRDYLMLMFFSIKKLFPNRKLVIILDSIDQLTSNDYNLEWLIEKFNKNIKMIYSTLPHHGNLLSMLQMKKIPHENFVHLKYLNIDLAKLIIKDWLNRINRSISTNQWSLIENMLSKATLYPLYIKIIFDILIKWRSYDVPDEKFLLCSTIDSTIKYLFELLEIEHGRLLFSRTIIYMTSFRDGISESEIEDILSLDDEVLYDIFEYHAPPLRKLPSALWARIKHDLQNYLVEKEVDDTRVIYWYHRRFIEVTNSFYIGKLYNKEEVFTNVVDFFNETWKSKPKPFKYNKYLMKKKNLNSEIAEEIRETSVQKTVFMDKDKVIHYNKRKLKELPNFVAHLNTAIAMQIAGKYIYWNYQFLSGLFSVCSYNEIVFNLGKISMSSMTYSLSGEAKQAYHELMIFNILLLQCMVAVKKYPESAGLQIVSRSLIFYGTSKYITDFIDQYDAESSVNCALIVPHQIQQPPGSDTIFSLEKHTEAIRCVVRGGVELGVVFSLSNRLNFIDFNSNNSFESDYDLEPTENDLKYLLVYVVDSVPLDKTLKEFEGGFIVASKNEIISYSFDMSVNFKKKFDSKNIVYLEIVSKNHLLVAFEKSIEFFNIFTGDLANQYAFESQIKFVQANIFLSNIKILKNYIIEPIVVIVIFETSDISLYLITGNLFNRNYTIRTENDISLRLIREIPSPGLQCESVVIWEAKDFLLVFNCNVILEIEFKLKATVTSLDELMLMNSIQIFVHLIKLNLDNKIKVEIKHSMSSGMLLIGSNKHVYHLFKDSKDNILMSELKGSYDNGFLIDSTKMVTFSKGTIRFWYFEHEKNVKKIALFREISNHYDEIIYWDYKNKMLTTASKDTTLKISTIEGINVNLKYLMFDKCQKEIVKLIQVSSTHVIALMANSNSLDLWCLPNGKILKQIDLPQNEITHDGLYETYFILVSNLIIDEDVPSSFLFIRGFKTDFQDKQILILKFKIKIEKGKNVKIIIFGNDLIILREDLNKPFIHVYKFDMNEMIKTKNDILTEPNHGFIDLSDLSVSNDLSLIQTDRVVITHKNKLLAIFLSPQLLIYELETKNLLICHKIDRVNVNSVKYFLSPTNLALNKLSNLSSVSNNTDSIIAQGNLNNLVLVNYDKKLEKLKIFKTDDLEPKRFFNSYVLGSNNLIAYDILNEELIGFQLNSKDSSVFKNISFKISISKSVLDLYGISSDEKYVYIVELNKNLRLFRYEDSKRLGETVMYSKIGNVSCSDEYICMAMQDNRIVSFLIADPMNPKSLEKIRNLESRSKERLKDPISSDLNSYFEHDERIMRYSEIFTPTIHYTELDKDIKLANRFNEIRKNIQEIELKRFFTVGCLINYLESNWAVDIIKKNPFFETNELLINNANSKNYARKNFNEFKHELLKSLTTNKLEMKAKNTGNISIANDVNLTSKACVIQ